MGLREDERRVAVTSSATMVAVNDADRSREARPADRPRALASVRADMVGWAA